VDKSIAIAVFIIYYADIVVTPPYTIKQLVERARLEYLAIEGKLEITARRDLTESKTYSQYVIDSKASNSRIFNKHGASHNAHPPMSDSPI
jgi:hypothetical protein